MNRILSTTVLFACIVMLTHTVNAEPLMIKNDSSIQTVLISHKDKRVTIKLSSGDELSGKVGEVTGELVVLHELTGKEFYDAAVKLKKIAAVIVRAK